MAVVSAKFLLRRALACATLARETEDDDCRERCLRLEQVYRRLAQDAVGQAAPAGAEPRGLTIPAIPATASADRHNRPAPSAR